MARSFWRMVAGGPVSAVSDGVVAANAAAPGNSRERRQGRFARCRNIAALGILLAAAVVADEQHGAAFGQGAAHAGCCRYAEFSESGILSAEVVIQRAPPTRPGAADSRASASSHAHSGPGCR